MAETTSARLLLRARKNTVAAVDPRHAVTADDQSRMLFILGRKSMSVDDLVGTFEAVYPERVRQNAGIGKDTLEKLLRSRLAGRDLDGAVHASVKPRPPLTGGLIIPR